MNYDYKIINTDPTIAFVKRAVLYVAILMLTIALALVVLFVLFERYLGLIAPGVMILASALTMIFVGRSAGSADYHFANDRLTVSFGRSNVEFLYENTTVEKNAENSDFFDKNIIKLSFINNRIVLKNTINDNSYTPQNKVVTYQDMTYILALDDYALALIGGVKNGL